MSSVLSDPELISSVRNGDISAYAGLYSRHADAAYRLAALLTQDPEDRQRLVSDSFAALRMALLGGGGPAVIFRTSMLTTVRDLHHDRLRRKRGLHVRSEPPSRQPLTALIGSPATPMSTASLVVAAVHRLPVRWQLVLWHVEVEREPATLVGPIVGLLPAEVPILAARARERLRSAYLKEMQQRADTPDCSWAAIRLAAGVANHHYDPDRRRLTDHIAACEPCGHRCAEFSRLETGVHGLLGPLVLGGLAEAYRAGGNEPAGRVTTGRSSTRRRLSVKGPPRIGLLSAAIAATAAVVALAGLHVVSPVPAPASGSDAPRAVADTGPSAPLAPNQPPAAIADVGVSLIGSPVPGDRTQLQVRIGNAGPAASGIVTLVLTLPVGASLGGTPPGRWECSGRTTTVVCSHPPLGRGSRVAVTMIVSLRSTAPHGGRARAVISPAVADPASRNNRAETSVIARPGTPSA